MMMINAQKMILGILLVLLGSLTIIQADDEALNLVPITADNVDQLQLIGRLGRGVATSLDWHPDGEVLAVGSGSGVWLLDESLQTITPTPIQTTVTDVAWSPDGSNIAVINGCSLEIWSADFAELVLSMDNCAYHVDWSADGRYLWALLPEKQSLLFEMATGESRLIDGQIDAWSPSGLRVFTTAWKDNQMILHIWETATAERIAEISLLAGYYDVLWSVNDETVATRCYDGEQINLCYVNVTSGDIQQLILDWSNTSQFPRFEDVMLHPDGEVFAYRNPSDHPAFFSTIWAINLQDGTLDLIAEGSAFDWKPNSNQITSIRGNGQIITYGDNRAESQFFNPSIHMMDIRPNHHQIATTGYGYYQDTYVWDMDYSWDDPFLQFYAEPAQVVQYTADGSGLIEGGIIGTDMVINQQIGLYDADTGAIFNLLTSYYGQETPSNWIFNADYSEGVQMPDLIFEDRTYTYWNNIIWSNYYRQVSVLDQPATDEWIHQFTPDLLNVSSTNNIDGLSGQLSDDGRLLFSPDTYYGVVYVWGVVGE